MDTKKPFKRVGTHHGKFHADEVIATAILKEIFDLDVIRTRKPEVLDNLDLIYDVGGGEFDHHDVEKKYRGSGTPYAACGLIWDRFGREVVTVKDKSLSREDVESVFEYVDAVLIEGVDAIDNGLRTSEVIIPTMSVSTMISGFNPPWYADTSEDDAFHQAVGFASVILNNTLNQQLAVIRARDKVVEAYKNRVKPEILVLDEYCPWGQILQEIDSKKEVLFVVYPNRDGYAMQTVRKGDGVFEARKDLPKEWAGKRDEELGRIIGIDDAVFCHPGRFIAGARSFKGIMKMADTAVDRPPEAVFSRIMWLLRKLVHRKEKRRTIEGRVKRYRRPR